MRLKPNYDQFETKRQARVEWIARALILTAGVAFAFGALVFLGMNWAGIANAILAALTNIYLGWANQPLYGKLFSLATASGLVGFLLVLTVLSGYKPAKDPQDSGSTKEDNNDA